MKDEIIEGMPVLYLTIDDLEKDGVDTISFVANPATKTKWYAFSEEYQFINNEKRIVTAPVMLADVPIRRDGHFVKFSKETILDMRNKYFMQNKIHRVNENHDSNKMVEGVYMVESFILDDRIDMSLFPNLTKGTWMASFYISDEDYWNDVIKAGRFSGFSLEGHFSPKKPKNTMNLLERLKSLFAETVKEDKWEDMKTADDRIIRVYSLENGGQKVKEITENGEVDVNDSSITLEDGTSLEITNSIITNIIPLEADMYPKKEKDNMKEENKEEKFSVEEFMEMLNCRCTGGERLQIRKFEKEDGKFEFSIEKELCKFANVMRTDGVAIYYEGEELIVGETPLFLDEALTEPAPDGEHELEGGLKATVEGGILVDLVEIETEETESEVEAKSYDKKMEVAFSEIMEQLKTMSSEIKSIKTENENLKTRVQKFAAEPSDKETKTTPTITGMSKEDKLKFFAKR